MKVQHLIIHPDGNWEKTTVWRLQGKIDRRWVSPQGKYFQSTVEINVCLGFLSAADGDEQEAYRLFKETKKLQTRLIDII